MEMLEEHRCFEGWQQRWRHDSSTLNCPMTFSIFLPPPRDHTPPPVLYWLSGLTCNDENFTTKAGAQRVAAELGIVLVMPDTSPRGEQVANDDGYDLGQGAGFYLNATQPPWATHYRMYDYLRDELPALVQSQFNVSDRCAISGHSMGGHGALIMALKNPGTVLNDANNQAKATFDLAKNLADGKGAADGTNWKIDNKVVRVPYVGVDKDNLAEFSKK